MDYLSLDEILYIHFNLPETDPIQPLLVPRLYKRVLVNSSDVEKNWYIVDHEDDMWRMVQKNVPIQYLEFRYKSEEDSWFIEFVAEHVD